MAAEDQAQSSVTNRYLDLEEDVLDQMDKAKSTKANFTKIYISMKANDDVQGLMFDPNEII